MLAFAGARGCVFVTSVGFTWEGFDEMDEVSGGGSAELLDEGSIEIEFAYCQSMLRL